MSAQADPHGTVPVCGQAHPPAVQVLVGEEQTFPQVPQLSGSVWVFVQEEPHADSPAWGQTQYPPVQLLVGDEQTVPQIPQLLGSVCVFVQDEPHSIPAFGHEQTPARQLPEQQSALTLIRAYEAISAADLARLSLLTPQTINGIVRALEARGAIRKEADPFNGRILRLSVTEEGRALNKRCRALTAPIEAALKAAMAPKLEGAVRRWLVDVAEAFLE